MEVIEEELSSRSTGFAMFVFDVRFCRYILFCCKQTR